MEIKPRDRRTLLRLSPMLFKTANGLMKAKGIHDFNDYLGDLIRRDMEVHQLFAVSRENHLPAAESVFENLMPPGGGQAATGHAPQTHHPTPVQGHAGHGGHPSAVPHP